MGDPVFLRRYRVWIRCSLSMILGIIFFTFIANTISFASSEGSHEAVGWLATDSYRVFNFTVLAIGIFFAIRKPVTKALGGRIKEIKSRLEDLEAKKIRAETKLAKYDEKLAKLNEESELILAEYVKQGEEAKSKIIAEAEIAANKLKDQAKKNIEHEFTQAKIQLQREIVDKALIKAQKIIKDKIDSGDQEKLVDEYLEKVVA